MAVAGKPYRQVSRRSTRSNAQIELQLVEEQSEDAETTLDLEDVGVFVGE